jgi:uncharacterized 2Fe-2S/4Fe-4S cluster protein (DUF4445 family)
MITLSGLANQTILELLKTANHPLRAPCAGRRVCGKCRLQVVDTSPIPVLAEPTLEEAQFLSPEDRQAGIRLGCMARFQRDGDVCVKLPDDTLVSLDHVFYPVFPAISNDQGTERFKKAPGLSKPMRVAVDIGTTTITVCLIDMARQRLAGFASEANSQKSFGSDVMARIKAVRDNPANLQKLQALVVTQVEQMIDQLLVTAHAGAVERIVVCGNTTMLHLLLGVDTDGMACLPFQPVFLDSKKHCAKDYGFKTLADCRLELLPGISAFVGADLTAGVLASGLHLADKPELLLDIGTNGEMVLGNSEGLSATATAAGPAFEGGHIEWGCPGIPGALDHAGWNDHGFWFSTIGNKPLVGVCGSGLIDSVAALYRAELISETGFLELPGNGDRFYPEAGNPLYLSQADIRQLQLAKAAIAAGIKVLCSKTGILLSDIQRVHLAGGFGSFINPASALAIGLLPAELNGRVVAAGNTALRGTVEAAIQPDAWTLCEQIAARTKVIDLSAEPEFMTIFVDSMLFPEN